jgi:hypothetical protein
VGVIVFKVTVAAEFNFIFSGRQLRQSVQWLSAREDFIEFRCRETLRRICLLGKFIRFFTQFFVVLEQNERDCWLQHLSCRISSAIAFSGITFRSHDPQNLGNLNFAVELA